MQKTKVAFQLNLKDKSIRAGYCNFECIFEQLTIYIVQSFVEYFAD